jgi:hypothetical protein
MYAGLQVLFVICFVFPTVIHILDSDLRAMVIIRKKQVAVVVVLSFALFFFAISFSFSYTFSTSSSTVLLSFALYLLLTLRSKILIKKRTVANLIKIFSDFYGS